MSFSELIIRFAIVIVLLFLLKMTVPFSGGGMITGIIGTILILVVIYTIYLRIIWDKKIIRMAKEKMKQKELEKKSLQSEKRLKKILPPKR